MTALSIGDTVSFKSHPYHSTSLGELITSEIIGEHLMTPPLLVVIEILHHSKGSYDDKSGNEILPKKSQSAKCLWYNSSLHQFEEAWLPQKELKKVPCEYDSISITSEEFKDWKNLKHSLVSLRTLKQELGKEKRSAKKDGIKEGYQTTHYLEYVSPVMELIEIRKFEIKESQFDPKTGEQKKDFPQYVAKCKWYNPKGGKFSERFIPVEALNQIPELNQESLDSIHNILEQEIFIYSEKMIDKSLKKYLFKPSLLYKSGYYYFSGYNILNNKEESIELNNKTTYIPVENPFTEIWPKFDGDHKLASIETFIKVNIEVSDYWRIKYENYHGEVTSRTITPKAIGTDEISTGGTTSTIKYLTAHCHLRDAERHFRFDRIRAIQIIEIPQS
ncbi:WYL domain-containing protein [Algoriphagus lacus]|uniref:WYL domain-containing protein n=1 Tax=Algoriphagus lacus TaxID=2056311 RepID=A0A418PMB5_9BACT|nr:WYL domain-containing protein [Algoriphagus lacus]RIW12163.1 WYL domain-containing protein [Algoriphagus lacus]